MKTRQPVQSPLLETSIIKEEDKFLFVKAIELSPAPLYRAINFSAKMNAEDFFISAQTSVQNIASRINSPLKENNHILTALGARIRSEQVKAITPNVKVIVLTHEFFKYYLANMEKYEKVKAILNAIPSTVKWVVFSGESHVVVRDFLMNHLPFHLTIYVYKPNGWHSHRDGKYQMIRARSVGVASTELSSLNDLQEECSETNTTANTTVNLAIDLTQDENDAQTAYSVEMGYSTAESDSNPINVSEEYLIQMGEEIRRNIECDIETEEEEIDIELIHHVGREKMQYSTSQTLEQTPHRVTGTQLPMEETLLLPSIVRVNSQKRVREEQYNELLNRYIHEYAQALANNKNSKIEFDTSAPFNRALKDLNNYFEALEKARAPSKRMAIANEKDKPMRKSVAEHTEDYIDFASTLVEKLKLGLQTYPALIGKEIIFINKTQSATSATGDAIEYRRDIHKNKPYQSNGGLNNLGGQYCPYPGIRLFDPHAQAAYELTPAVTPKFAPVVPTKSAPKSGERSWPLAKNTMSASRPIYKLPGFNRLGASNSASRANLPDRVLKKMEEKRKEKESSNTMAQTRQSFLK